MQGLKNIKCLDGVSHGDQESNLWMNIRGWVFRNINSYLCRDIHCGCCGGRVCPGSDHGHNDENGGGDDEGVGGDLGGVCTEVGEYQFALEFGGCR